MKALIMAAGYGTRLEPLTIAVPKPMVPIVNVPCMQHNLELLKRHGYKNIVANIHYHPEQIENYFGDGNAFGVNLEYSFEEELLGTAGGVKRMAKIAKVKDTCLVLSSDALTDINLGKMLEFHKRKKAKITIALAKVKEVSEFGLAVMDSDQRITAFQEKPKAQEAHSDLANTGIYIFEPEVLEMIPEGPYDFGKQLFPELIAEKYGIYGYPIIEYWSDVGGLSQYIDSCYDAMRGTVRIKIPGKKAGASIWIGERQSIERSARFEGSVIIGDRCQIGKDVYIKDSVIGDKCVISDGAIVTGSVIWSDTFISMNAQVNRSVIGNWCRIEKQARILEGSILANRCLVRKNAQVPAMSRLNPGSIA